MKVSRDRLLLLRHLEHLIGSECYNANIQNWGPNGTFYGEGRDFRYPITFTNKDGEKVKKRGMYADFPAEVQMTGRYAFGANELHIMSALNKVLEYLEKEHSLKV